MRLARDEADETPPEKKLSDEQRAALRLQIERQTLSLVWSLTKRDIETTARGVVGALLDGVNGDGDGVNGDGVNAAVQQSAGDRRAKADALLVLGSVFGKARGFAEVVHGELPPAAEQASRLTLHDGWCPPPPSLTVVCPPRRSGSPTRCFAPCWVVCPSFSRRCASSPCRRAS